LIVGRAACSLDGGDVLRLHALLALGSLVGDFGAFFEGFEPAATYTSVMNEEVVASVVWLDEAVTLLLLVEPLDRSLGNVPEPAFLFPWGNPRFDCGGNIPE
jgi:hypothetical protein